MTILFECFSDCSFRVYQSFAYNPTGDKELYRALKAGLGAHCSGAKPRLYVTIRTGYFMPSYIVCLPDNYFLKEMIIQKGFV